MKRLLLLGGGHAHLHVLRGLAAAPIPGVEVTLVSPFARHHYSGMVPGYLQGQYREAELAFDLARLCRAARARFVEAYADRIDAGSGVAEAAGAAHPFDVLSLDIGSEASALDVPGVLAHAHTVRPMTRAIALGREADRAIAAARDGVVRVAVVGAGAAGVEVALALHRRVAAAGRRPAVTLVEAGPRILPDYAPAVRACAQAILSRRGIDALVGDPVSRVRADEVILASGKGLVAGLTAWLTGAAAPRLIAGADLPRDARGFLLVDATLQSVDGSPVWGAGDCVGLAGHPELPKAGVYAVREAPVLEANLRAALGAGTPRPYLPQQGFLALLNTGDDKALLRWRGLVRHARWAFWLKDMIDRRFVRSYRHVA